WRPNPEGVAAICASLPHEPELMRAAPHWLGDGMTGDHMPYLAWYEVEIRNDDGAVWKPKGEEPPYGPQKGNNCTSEGLMHVLDLTQCLMAIDGTSSENVVVPHRTCVE